MSARHYTTSAADDAAQILADIARTGQSSMWAGTLGQVRERAESLKPFNVVYVDDMAGTWALKKKPAYDPDVCSFCHDGHHDRCSQKTYPNAPAATCECKACRAPQPDLTTRSARAEALLEEIDRCGYGGAGTEQAERISRFVNWLPEPTEPK